MDINIFTQIGFVVLVGLACKNAILIVEFAKAQREAGVPRYAGDAGGVPAAAAADHDDVVRVHPRRGAAGAVGGRRRRDAADAGHGRLRGMLGVTLFGIFLTPVFYYVIQWFTDTFWPVAAAANGGEAAGHGPHVEERPDHMLPLDPDAGRPEHDGGFRAGR